MKIPETVFIYGVPYEVILTDDPIMLDGDELEALCCRDAEVKVILISNKICKTKEKKLSALLHEMGHGIFAEGSLCQSSISNDLEEIICDQFGTVMTDLILGSYK